MYHTLCSIYISDYVVSIVYMDTLLFDRVLSHPYLRVILLQVEVFVLFSDFVCSLSRDFQQRVSVIKWRVYLR